MMTAIDAAAAAASTCHYNYNIGILLVCMRTKSKIPTKLKRSKTKCNFSIIQVVIQWTTASDEKTMKIALIVNIVVQLIVWQSAMDLFFFFAIAWLGCEFSMLYVNLKSKDIFANSILSYNSLILSVHQQQGEPQDYDEAFSWDFGTHRSSLALSLAD